MKKRLPFILAVVLCGACPLLAQRPDEKHPAPPAAPPHNEEQHPPKANNGRVPPPPPKRENPPNNKVQEHRQENNQPNRPVDRQENRPENRQEQTRQDNRPEPRRDTRQENVRPHVENDRWYGHDENDERYRVARPLEHGRFERSGREYRYRAERIDRDRHWFWVPGGYYFHVADWDWPIAADWCWDCGDNLVVYEDPDHPGWYLVYNTDTGEYVHAEYLGG